MNRVLVFLVFVTLMSGCSSCGRTAVNRTTEQTDANANTSGESQFASYTDANAALAEGNRLLDENQTEQAIAALKQAVKINPDLADAWFQLGIAYGIKELQAERSGELVEPASNSKERVKPNSERAFDKAVEAYKKQLKADPKDDAAQFNLGRTYAKLNEDEEAEDAFKEAVKLKPDDTEYQTELGAVLIKLAKYREAIEPLKKAVTLDESNSRALDLLDDAEAGRQRLSYVAPNNVNTANANKNANANANMSSNSNSNSAPKQNANANLRPKKDDTKKTVQPVNKPK
jgi:cytochrome c-type biogenesis protein CcmH/NrfG